MASLRDHLAAQVTALLDSVHETGDVEAVHTTRVRARRLRSVLRTHRRFLPAPPPPGLLDDLRWLGHVAGPVRDLDVLAEHLRHADAPGPDRHAWLAALASDRAAARATAESALSGARLRGLLRDLGALLASPEPAPAAPGVGSLRRETRRLLRLADHAGAVAPDHPQRGEALHDVRKAAKRLRYAAEALGDPTGPPGRLADAAEAVQTSLGERLDHGLAADWLEAYAERTPDPALAAASRAQAARDRALATHDLDAYGRALDRVRALAVGWE